MVRYARNERFLFVNSQWRIPLLMHFSFIDYFIFTGGFMIGLLRYAKDYRKQIVLGPF